jgi:hypothetical protein
LLSVFTLDRLQQRGVARPYPVKKGQKHSVEGRRTDLPAGERSTVHNEFEEVDLDILGGRLVNILQDLAQRASGWANASSILQAAW